MNRKRIFSLSMYLTGLIMCALGVALTAKAAMGVGAIQAPAYAVYMKVSEKVPSYTFGISSYLSEALFLIIMCLIIGKFRAKYLLSFVTAVLFGIILDFFNGILGTQGTGSMILRIVRLLLGIVCTSFAVACYFRTDMPLEVWELFVTEVSGRFNLDKARFKWFFDICMLIIGTFLCIVFFGRFRSDVIGAGTVMCAVFIGPLIGMFGKLLDRLKNRIGV